MQLRIAPIRLKNVIRKREAFIESLKGVSEEDWYTSTNLELTNFYIENALELQDVVKLSQKFLKKGSQDRV